MNILFVADPLPTFNTKKDSTFAMMRAAAARGHFIAHCTPADLRWSSSGKVEARAQALGLTGELQDWYRAAPPAPLPLHAADAVVMRKDPPFDNEYFYATHLLERAEREGARVYNKPRALRDHSEKLALMEFPQFIPPTLVTRSEADIRAFHDEHQDIILKPLDGMGGAGIFRVKYEGLNLGAIIETLNRFGTQTVMVQKYLPAIAAGDKRVLLIDGKPVPHALARIPQRGEVRGNLAAGGRGEARKLEPRERQIAAAVGPVLAARGLLLVGLDVIGDHLTEINVTSPTCFQEITDQTGFDVAAMFIDALEAVVARDRGAVPPPAAPAPNGGEV